MDVRVVPRLLQEGRRLGFLRNEAEETERQTLDVGRRPSLGCPAPFPGLGSTLSQPVPHQGSGGLDFLMGPYLLTISVTAVLPSGLVAGAGGGFTEG